MYSGADLDVLRIRFYEKILENAMGIPLDFSPEKEGVSLYGKAFDESGERHDHRN